MVTTSVNSRSGIVRCVWDFVGAPFRLMFLEQATVAKFGWTTLEEERMRAVLPQVQGRLLDIGAGPNTLVKRYGNGVGVDVVDRGGGTWLIQSAEALPFAGESFDTITFLACLNYIPNRERVLSTEVRRVLKPGGRLIITMINPLLGHVGHRIWSHREDRKGSSISDREADGLWINDVIRMCASARFRLVMHRRFVYGLNNLLVFERLV